MAATRNQCLQKAVVCLLGCLLAQLLFGFLPSQSWAFAGPALQSRLAARRSALLIQAAGPTGGNDMDDLFSFSAEDKVPAVQGALEQTDPKQVTQAAASSLNAVKAKLPDAASGSKKFDPSQVAQSVSDSADSVGSAALTKLKTVFPQLEPQLSTLEPKQLVLVAVAATVAFLAVILSGDSGSNTGDSTVTPKAAGSTASSSGSSSTTTTTASSGTPVVSSQQPLPVPETAGSAAPPAVAEPPPAPAPADFIELTDRNEVKSAGFIAFLVGFALGGIWLGGALFVVASWAGTRRTDDVATVVKGLGRTSLKVVNFGAYLDGKYKLAEQLGSGITNASASVKEEYKQAGAIIDPAASAVGVVVDNSENIKDSVDSLTTTATGAACLVGDKAVDLLDLAVDALQGSDKDKTTDVEQRLDKADKGNKASTENVADVKVPATSQKEQVLTGARESAPSSATVNKGNGASMDSIIDLSVTPVRFRVPATSQK